MPSSATGQDIAVSIRKRKTEAMVVITRTGVIIVPIMATVIIIAITNAQALARKTMEDILVVRVLRLAIENARYGRSVLTMVPVVLILIVSATTIVQTTSVRTIRKNMNRSVIVAICGDYYCYDCHVSIGKVLKTTARPLL